MLDEFQDLMHGKPGLTAEAEIQIEMGSAYPISRPPYRLYAVKSKAMDDAVRELLELGIVRPSRSPWPSLALLVAKRDGTKRLCVDYKNLNRITISDHFPLPLIELPSGPFRKGKVHFDIRSSKGLSPSTSTC